MCFYSAYRFDSRWYFIWNDQIYSRERRSHGSDEEMGNRYDNSQYYFIFFTSQSYQTNIYNIQEHGFICPHHIGSIWKRELLWNVVFEICTNSLSSLSLVPVLHWRYSKQANFTLVCFCLSSPWWTLLSIWNFYSGSFDSRLLHRGDWNLDAHARITSIRFESESKR